MRLWARRLMVHLRATLTNEDRPLTCTLLPTYRPARETAVTAVTRGSDGRTMHSRLCGRERPRSCGSAANPARARTLAPTLTSVAPRTKLPNIPPLCALWL